jgi:hypothetical protein
MSGETAQDFGQEASSARPAPTAEVMAGIATMLLKERDIQFADTRVMFEYESEAS